MFNKSLREEALDNLKRAQSRYQSEQKGLIKDAEMLFQIRMRLKPLMDEAWDYINSLRNKPVEMDTELKAIQIETKKFTGLVASIEKELDKVNLTTGGTVAAGAAAGAGLAAFGPSAAMAIATTFGTASTGTAIASLSGAAATNAALAWLGGGALIAGGGGTAAGSALLGMAGPIGWAIGGGALLTAGLIKSGKNKKIAEEANNHAIKIRKQVSVIGGTRKEVKEISNSSVAILDVFPELFNLCKSFPSDYRTFTNEQKLRLGALVNNTRAGSELLNRPVGANA
jgi:hypothetical protein